MGAMHPDMIVFVFETLYAARMCRTVAPQEHKDSATEPSLHLNASSVMPTPTMVVLSDRSAFPHDTVTSTHPEIGSDAPVQISSSSHNLGTVPPYATDVDVDRCKDQEIGCDAVCPSSAAYSDGSLHDSYQVIGSADNDAASAVQEIEYKAAAASLNEIGAGSRESISSVVECVEERERSFDVARCSSADVDVGMTGRLGLAKPVFVRESEANSRASDELCTPVFPEDFSQEQVSHTCPTSEALTQGAY